MRLALAGDTMLGRQVAARIDAGGGPLWSGDVVAAVAEADLAICNLECCISDRGEPWPDPAKPFFFRAPPVAAELLAGLGVHAVTLANNHALDYGEAALRDTLRHLDGNQAQLIERGRPQPARETAYAIERLGGKPRFSWRESNPLTADGVRLSAAGDDVCRAEFLLDPLVA